MKKLTRFTVSICTLVLFSLNARGAIVANFNVPASICTQLEVDFINTSSGMSGSDTSDWVVGTFSLKNTKDVKGYTFFTSGTYTVKLKVHNGSQKDSITKTIVVKNNPKPKFNYVSHCEDTAVTFVAVSDTGIKTYSWDFGDGKTASGSSTSHKYLAAGTYQVKVFSIANSGCSDTVRTSVTVYDYPVPDFITKNGCVDSVFWFVQNSSLSSGSMNVTWDFGDPSSGATNSFTTSGVKGDSTSHVFSGPGNFTVSMTVESNPYGCKKKIQKVITVYPLPTTWHVVTNDCRNVGVKFDDSSSGLNIIGYYWDFGDSTFSTSKNVLHKYGKDTTYTVKHYAITKYGCSKVDAFKVTPYTLPHVFFTSSNAACEDTIISFKDKSYVPGGSINAWDWNFGDPGSTNNTSTNNIAIHVYSKPGKYNVQLVITSAKGCTDTLIKQITILAKPVSKFSPTSGCQFSEVSFQDLSYTIDKSKISSWYWDFGDPTGNGSNNSTLQNPKHTYEKFAGKYKVTLVTTSVNGCKDTLVQDINISSSPGTDYTTPGVCKGSPTQFNSSIKGAAWYYWDFGDGSKSTLQNPSHLFATGGAHTIRHATGSSATGCSDTISHTFSTSPAPQADFNFTAGCTYDAVKFDDISTVPSGGAVIVSRYWDFGDGTTDNIAKPSHRFSTPGAHSVKLTSTTNNGCQDSITKIVTVGTQPTADFYYTAGCREEGVQFTDQSTMVGGSIVSYEWEFESLAGTQSTQQSPFYKYLTGGPKTVTLIVTNDKGCQDTITKIIYVSSEPKNDFIYSSGCAGQSISFTDKTVIDTPSVITTWKWDFGDGDASTDQNPTHLFAGAGTYNVRLITESNQGCVDTLFKNVVINPNPEPNFYWEGSCVFEDLTFHDSSIVSSGTISGWYWDWNDGDYGYTKDPSHVYTAPGVYHVKFTMTTDAGCTNSISKDVEIFSLPTAMFESDEVCFRDSTQFKNKSISDTTNNKVVGFEWVFDDPNSGIYNLSTEENPKHLFTADGVYNVTLSINTKHGCQANVTQQVTVKASPTAMFTHSPTIATRRNPFMTFTDASTNAISWEWSINGYKKTDQNTSFTFEDTGRYPVKLTVMNSIGCSSTYIDTIEVIEEPVLYIPNSFTPNNDGVNDVWKPMGVNILAYNLRILDPWGQEVFNTSDFAQPWDGKFNGKQSPEGVYLYYITIKDFANEEIRSHWGYIHLIK